MKHFLTLILLSIATSITNAQGINFDNKLSWTQIQQKAKKENKYIFIDAYTTWCVPCKVMDQNVYPTAEAGEALNAQFISIKIQMDKTGKDNDYVKSWYNDAEALKRQFEISAYPTLLFLTPDGKLARKKIGGVDAKGLAVLAKDAQNPDKRFDYFFDLYKAKKLNFKEYPTLAKLADEIGKRDTAYLVRSQFKKSYLDKLPMSRLLTRDNLNFLLRNPDLISSKDRFYLFCKNEPARLDSNTKALQVPGGLSRQDAKVMVRSVMVREQITDQLYDKSGKLVSSPDWTRIKKDFLNHYHEDDGLKTFYDNKIQFYRSIGDWDGFAGSIDELLANCPTVLSDEIFLKILNNYAWYGVFANSNSPKVLTAAIKWVDLIIVKVPEDLDYLDTKANLLYKLGKKEEAMVLEQSIIDQLVKKTGKSAQDAAGDYYTTMQKMKRGEATWGE